MLIRLARRRAYEFNFTRIRDDIPIPLSNNVYIRGCDKQVRLFEFVFLDYFA